MTVIRPNSISGITSLTAHRGSIDFYAHDGSAATFNNINSNVTSGVSTFASLNITGDLDVGGALTYEDVTNIDSVGVITARNAIVISEDNAIHFRGTAADDADAILRASAGGGQLLINSRNDAIINIDSNNDSTDAHFAVAHGAATGSSTELFRVQENGNIGINEASPGTKLAIGGSTIDSSNVLTFGKRVAGSNSNLPVIGHHSDGSGSGIAICATSTDGKIHFFTGNGSAGFGDGSNAERMRIDASGNIGIGENSPDRLLHIKGSSSTAYSGGSDTADYNFLKIENTTDDKSAGIFFAIGSNGEAAITATEVADGATDIAFQNRGGGVRSEKLRMRSDGDVIIGTDDLESQLGSRRRLAVCDTTNGALLHLRGQSPAIFFDQSGGNIGKIYLDSVDLAIYSNTPNSEGTERLRIKSGGEITNGNLVINGFANQNTPGGYSQYQSDNHANTLFGQNLKLGASSGSGNHQIEIINQHASIGGAGMYIGGNGSNQQNAINFYAEAANQSPGTNVTANRRAQVNSSSFFTWVEPRNQSSNAQSYLRTFGFTFNLQDGETETLFYNQDGYRRIWYEIYVQSGHGSNGYGYILANISRYGMQVHDVDWHVSHTSYAFSGSVNGNVNRNGIKFTRSGWSNTNITYYVIVKCFSPAGGTPYGNSGLTDPTYRYFTQGY